MSIVRNEFSFRRSSEIADVEIDIADYDKAGRYTTDGRVTLAGNGEKPLFIFAESAAALSSVSIIHFGMGGRMALKLSGSGSDGSKLAMKSDGSGKIVASATAETAAMASTDFAISLDDWNDGDVVEVEIVNS